MFDTIVLIYSEKFTKRIEIFKKMCYNEKTRVRISEQKHVKKVRISEQKSTKKVRLDELFGGKNELYFSKRSI